MPTEEDRRWARERGQSPGAKGFREKMEQRMRESRARTDTQGYIAPARSLSPQVRTKSKSKSRSKSRSRSYTGSPPGDDPPPPEIPVQLSPSPERLPDMSTWAAESARARRGHSREPQTEAQAQRSVTRERSLEQEVRPPDESYFERLIPEKGDPSHVRKQERGPAWSAGSESMPRALHDVSPSMSGTRSRSLSQRAREASRGSRFNDVIRSGSRDARLGRGYGIQRSLSRQPEDIPVHSPTVKHEVAPTLDRYGADPTGVMHLRAEYRGKMEEPEHRRLEPIREHGRATRDMQRLARVRSQEHTITGEWRARTTGRMYEEERKRKQRERAGAARVQKRAKVDEDTALKRSARRRQITRE